MDNAGSAVSFLSFLSVYTLDGAGGGVGRSPSEFREQTGANR